MKTIWKLTFAFLILVSTQCAFADNSDITKQLSNPLASLISVPIQLNRDTGFGTPNGEKTTLNIQPVIPFTLTPSINLITRTVIPYKWQTDIGGMTGTKSGWGDTTVSLWLSPSQASNGVTWGLGPIVYIPTSSDLDFGVGEWGGGVTGVALAQPGQWTIGGLANHVWSFESGDLNSTFIQPFVAYAAPNQWTFTLNSESTYDWNADQWTAPVNFTVSKLVSIGGQKVSLQGGVRYYVESPDTGPDGWGLRLATTFVFPKKPKQ